MAGTASAAVVSVQLALGAVGGYAVAALHDGRTPLSTVATIALAGLIGLAAFLLRTRTLAAVPDRPEALAACLPQIAEKREPPNKLPPRRTASGRPR